MGALKALHCQQCTLDALWKRCTLETMHPYSTSFSQKILDLQSKQRGATQRLNLQGKLTSKHSCCNNSLFSKLASQTTGRGLFLWGATEELTHSQGGGFDPQTERRSVSRALPLSSSLFPSNLRPIQVKTRNMAYNHLVPPGDTSGVCDIWHKVDQISNENLSLKIVLKHICRANCFTLIK